MEGKLLVTWKRSTIRRPKDQLQNIHGLGFRRLNQTLEIDDTPDNRGMLFKVRHLVVIKEQQD